MINTSKADDNDLDFVPTFLDTPRRVDSHPESYLAAESWISLTCKIGHLSTVFRASLMLCVAATISQSGWIWFAQRTRPLRDLYWYDAASRGSLGSIRLLWNLRFIRPACIGALITITTLALDPFFQQTIKYQGRPAVDPDQRAEAVAAYGYNGSIGLEDVFGDSYLLMPYNLKAAMFSGLYSSNQMTFPSPPFSCPLGNCTWDPFATLSLDSSCLDITSSVSLNCSNSFLGGSGITCNFASSNDDLLATMLNGTTTRVMMEMETYLPRNSLPALIPYLIPYRDITGALATVQWVKVKDFLLANTPVGALVMPNTTYEAGRCLVYLSVKQVEAKVDNGVYSERVLQEYNHIPNVTAPPMYTLNGTDFYFRDPWTWDRDLIFQPKFAPKRNFTVTWSDFDVLASSIMQLVQLNEEGGVATVSTGDSAGVGGPPVLVMLLQADNVTTAMQNMAHYMTTALRANDTQLLQNKMHNASLIAPNQSVEGRVWVQKQFVIVIWAWLTLPAVTFLTAILFFCITITRTRIHMVGVWKSSPLTLFFHTGFNNGSSISDEVPSEALHTSDGMYTAAGAISMRAVRASSVKFEVAREESRKLSRDELEIWR
ncbi:hypothetical protein NA57DRAFT_60390 [Rhizodiscina lignyota]|uniref:Uncharacterized protein n=1 Tax=Rhizodiscina lignyota TaxID=1504668 RepID=A0A9P4I7I7_9PEZI|nr:hypothetical protein NA57DRAFT_60390 [Rhizodiscina lignyota]